MKNLLYTTILFLFCSFIFTSCEKDKVSLSNDELIIGTWDCESIAGKSVAGTGLEFTLTFKSNKTGTMSMTIPPDPIENFTFDWSISGSTLTIDDGIEPMVMTIKSLTKNAATLVWDGTDMVFSKM